MRMVIETYESTAQSTKAKLLPSKKYNKIVKDNNPALVYSFGFFTLGTSKRLLGIFFERMCNYFGEKDKYSRREPMK